MKIARWEYLAVVAILTVGAWLRFSHLDLGEFKGDEAAAANLAVRFVKGGDLPTAGLVSSVGVTNPPLFIYLLIPMFFITTNVVAVSAMIAALGLAAVAATWWIGRKYYGAWCGLVASAMFATAPWAVIYSRKIWGQDFVPVLTTGLMWALHALVIGKKPKAMFWVVLLPLAVIQIHFSGLALTAMVVGLLAVLRPKMDWRWAAGGLVAAFILLLPYLQMESEKNWDDFRRARAQIGGQRRDIPKGMTIDPEWGTALPRRSGEAWIHAVSLINSGQIEEVIGFDEPAFAATVRPWEVLQLIQRALTIASAVWLLVLVARGKWQAQREIILLAWLSVPVLVYVGARLWTFLSYYAILWPAWFLAVGAAVERAPRVRWLAMAALASCVGSVLFMVSLYRFIEAKGGAHGSYGTAVKYKLQAARRLADGPAAYERGRLRQVDQLGRREPAEFELPFLVGLDGATGTVPTTQIVLVYDANRANYQPEDVPQLANLPHESFGPIRLYFLE